MRQVYQISSDSFYVKGKDLLIDDNEAIPTGYTNVPPMTQNNDGSFTSFFMPKWNGSQWTEGQSDTELFSIAQNNKKVQLTHSFLSSLLNGFTSNADGTSRTYAIDSVALARWTGTLANINSGKITTVTLKDFNKNKITLTASQFQQMAADGFNFYESQEQNLWTKEDDVNAIQLANYASLSDAINAVNAITY